MFYGNAITTDIERGTTPTEYLTSYARRNYTTFFTGDRLVIRANASTTVASARTTMEVAGNTNASMVSVSYFVCDESSWRVCVPRSTNPAAAFNPIAARCFIHFLSNTEKDNFILFTTSVYYAKRFEDTDFDTVQLLWFVGAAALIIGTALAGNVVALTAVVCLLLLKTGSPTASWGEEDFWEVLERNDRRTIPEP